MNAQTRKTLHNLNRLYLYLGTWKAVADWAWVNRATVNKWFAGTRKPCQSACFHITQVTRKLTGKAA